MVIIMMANQFLTTTPVLELRDVTRIHGSGVTAVHALRGAGIDVQVRSFEERSVAPSEDGGNASACAFVELSEVGGQGGERYGVGMDANIVTASLRAIVSGINRLQPDFARAPAARAA